MKKYWAFFRANLQVTLAYRGPIFIWVFSNLINVVAILAVWLAVSAGDRIGGYTKPELMSYYLATLFLQWLNGWFPFYDVAYEIKKGEIVFSLVKPFSYYWRKFFEELGWHTVGLWVGLLASFLVALFFKGNFVFDFRFSRPILVILAVISSILVVFGLSLCQGLTAFWLTEVYALDSIFWISRSLLGGQGIPLSFIPAGFFQKLVRFLPFRYTFSFPLEIYFNKLTDREIFAGFGLSFGWAVVFYYLYRLMWAKGRKKYTAFGQ